MYRPRPRTKGTFVHRRPPSQFSFCDSDTELTDVTGVTVDLPCPVRHRPSLPTPVPAVISTSTGDPRPEGGRGSGRRRHRCLSFRLLHRNRGRNSCPGSPDPPDPPEKV